MKSLLAKKILCVCVCVCLFYIPSDKKLYVWFIETLGCSVTSTKLPIIFTGTPTATECGGRSVMTKPPAPTWQPSPIFTLPRTLVPAPSKTPLPT